MEKFVIYTQGMENYGAHQDSGKFSNDDHCWKFKGGTTYVVSGVERVQDAVAFVMAAFSDNGIGWKEFPCHWTTQSEWLAEMSSDDQEFQDFQKETAYCVSPNTGKKYTRYKERATA